MCRQRSGIQRLNNVNITIPWVLPGTDKSISWEAHAGLDRARPRCFQEPFQRL